MADTALTYSYEILSIDLETSIVEVLYHSTDALDDDVIVYVKINDPTNRNAVVKTLMLKSPTEYWTRIKNLKTSSHIQNSTVVVKNNVALNALKGLSSSVTNMIGPNGAEPVGDLFARNKLRADLAKANTGKI